MGWRPGRNTGCHALGTLMPAQSGPHCSPKEVAVVLTPGLRAMPAGRPAPDILPFSVGSLGLLTLPVFQAPATAAPPPGPPEHLPGSHSHRGVDRAGVRGPSSCPPSPTSKPMAHEGSQPRGFQDPGLECDGDVSLGQS